MTAGIIYADNYWKSLYNFQYWHVFPDATGMIGSAGMDAITYFLDACKVMDKSTDVYQEWDLR